MKNILKIMAIYFVAGFGTSIGLGAGMKVCKKLLDE